MTLRYYQIEYDNSAYCVTCPKGTIARFSSMEDALDAMRDFEHKSFPENWERTPPAMRYAKQRYYGG